MVLCPSTIHHPSAHPFICQSSPRTLRSAAASVALRPDVSTYPEHRSTWQPYVVIAWRRFPFASTQSHQGPGGSGLQILDLEGGPPDRHKHRAIPPGAPKTMSIRSNTFRRRTTHHELLRLKGSGEHVDRCGEAFFFGLPAEPLRHARCRDVDHLNFRGSHSPTAVASTSPNDDRPA
ncbi:hypothetical protein CSOJ01_04858 [Colletotrichum sojae]|uniref:Uncharacterized protein n=1 Tax=Colletotrichum sojae TaxID=2175907 RepID=A0A8H6JH68_9PEZI|nr:hypothetical protein CSOJ01_04858 [Colletotrichum sojae]